MMAAAAPHPAARAGARRWTLLAHSPAADPALQLPGTARRCDRCRRAMVVALGWRRLVLHRVACACCWPCRWWRRPVRVALPVGRDTGCALLAAMLRSNRWNGPACATRAACSARPVCAVRDLLLDQGPRRCCWPDRRDARARARCCCGRPRGGRADAGAETGPVRPPSDGWWRSEPLARRRLAVPAAGDAAVGCAGARTCAPRHCRTAWQHGGCWIHERRHAACACSSSAPRPRRRSVLARTGPGESMDAPGRGRAGPAPLPPATVLQSTRRYDYTLEMEPTTVASGRARAGVGCDDGLSLSRTTGLYGPRPLSATPAGACGRRRRCLRARPQGDVAPGGAAPPGRLQPADAGTGTAVAARGRERRRRDRRTRPALGPRGIRLHARHAAPGPPRGGRVPVRAEGRLLRTLRIGLRGAAARRDPRGGQGYVGGLSHHSALLAGAELGAHAWRRPGCGPCCAGRHDGRGRPESITTPSTTARPVPWASARDDSSLPESGCVAAGKPSSRLDPRASADTERVGIDNRGPGGLCLASPSGAGLDVWLTPAADASAPRC